MKRTIILTTFILLISCTLASLTVAQTAITTLENEEGETVLKSFDDGGFLLLGDYSPFFVVGSPPESVPIEGEGVRLMWYPAKAAFRAGHVSDNQWNEENIGFYSIATGFNTTASGTTSTALGFETVANGNQSTAMGSNTKASGFRSTAMGRTTTAEGEASTATGSKTTASGFGSTAMGANTTASGNWSTALGENTKASGLASTTIGTRTVAATAFSLSVGRWNESNQSSDFTAFVVGNGTSSSERSDALHLHRNGNLTIAGTLTQNSDRRLKTNIEPIGEGTLAKLGAIEPVRYQFKNQQTHPEGKQIGLIAQQVQQQFPELVSENSSGYLSLSYSNLSTVLLKGMQEQQEQIEQLQAKADRVDALEERLASIEQGNSSQIAGISLPGILFIAGVAAIGGLFWKRRSDTQTSFNNNPHTS